MVPGSAVREAASDDLDLLALRYDLALDRAMADRDEHLAAELAPLLEERAFHDEIEELGVAAGEVLEVVELASLFRSGLARDSAIQELTHAASADARSHALTVGDEAQARYRRTLAVAAALVIATVAMALLVARSIARPLRVLARRARKSVVWGKRGSVSVDLGGRR